MSIEPPEVRTGIKRAMGFEPTTSALGRLHSTTELRPQRQSLIDKYLQRILLELDGILDSVQNRRAAIGTNMSGAHHQANRTEVELPMARGRPQVPYRPKAGGPPIAGLYRCPDGRWRINATGEKFTEHDEHRAIARFRRWEAENSGKKPAFRLTTSEAPSGDGPKVASVKLPAIR
jgi:hypothetical protein